MRPSKQPVMVMGQETEYGISFLNENSVRKIEDPRGHGFIIDAIGGTDLSHSGLSQGILYSSCISSGIFLSNGARFYIDCNHPEYATPECSNPWDLVRYVRAGDEHVRQFAYENDRAASLVNISCDKSMSSWSTWGCHESYSFSTAISALSLSKAGRFWTRKLLMPHLASRAILCGSGGFIRRGREVSFSISPRLEMFFKSRFSHSSTGGRGLVNLRDEPHGTQGRLHLTCGDALMSDRALLVRAASTALIVVIVDNMISNATIATIMTPFKMAVAAKGLELKPIEALRTFMADPDLRSKTETSAGSLNAIQVQQRLVSAVKMCIDECRGEAWMPPWADEAWCVWNEHVEMLASGGEAALCLDWAIKRAIFGNVAGPAAKLEANARFSMMGTGIFGQINRQLKCKAGIVGVKRAMSVPPRDTRAWLRGNLIKEKNDKILEMDWSYWYEKSSRGGGFKHLMRDPMDSQGTSAKELDGNTKLPV